MKKKISLVLLILSILLILTSCGEYTGSYSTWDDLILDLVKDIYNREEKINKDIKYIALDIFKIDDKEKFKKDFQKVVGEEIEIIYKSIEELQSEGKWQDISTEKEITMEVVDGISISVIQKGDYALEVYKLKNSNSSIGVKYKIKDLKNKYSYQITNVFGS